jgi:hypothetical protein
VDTASQVVTTGGQAVTGTLTRNNAARSPSSGEPQCTSSKLNTDRLLLQAMKCLNSCCKHVLVKLNYVLSGGAWGKMELVNENVTLAAMMSSERWVTRCVSLFEASSGTMTLNVCFSMTKTAGTFRRASDWRGICIILNYQERSLTASCTGTYPG